MPSFGRTQAFSLILACAGLVGVVASGSLLFDAWYARWTWAQSEERLSIERSMPAGAPALATPTPDDLWLPASERVTRPQEPAPQRAPSAPNLRSAGSPPRQALAPPAPVGAGTVRAGRPNAPRLEIQGTELRFLDVPEPGSHAALVVTVANNSETPSPPVVLSVPLAWFDRFSVLGAIPPVLDDRESKSGYRQFEFPGVAPGETTTRELHVIVVGGDVGAPRIRLALRDGAALGEKIPEIVGPAPRAGPVRALSIPRLNIRTGVVDTTWEPPSFVAGQISTTAPLGEGNSVLVGHRRGPAGNVFSRLLSARLGDEVLAAAHGINQRYIVSEIRTLPGNDITPLEPTETPRLTLMTCTGTWNPLTGDYSHRVWVIAEPPEQARATLAAASARATEAAAMATSPSEAAKARGEATYARAAIILIDAAQRRSP